MNAVDTNVLFYAHDSREAAKQAKAVSLGATALAYRKVFPDK